MTLLRTIRVHRRNSAFLYAMLESLEGMASYTTLPEEEGATHRDIEVCIPDAFRAEVDQVIEGLRKKFPIVVDAAGTAVDRITYEDTTC